MSDLTERLLDPLDCLDTTSVFALCREAADEIERLQYEIYKLRYAFGCMPCTCSGQETCLRCEVLEG